MERWAPDIFDYDDFRAFIRDFYEAAHAAKPAYWTYRNIAHLAGYSRNAPNTVPRVIKGGSISDRLTEGLVKAFRMNRREATYFRDLIEWTQAETDERKNRALERLSVSRRFRAAARLDSSRYDYLSRWYFPAIRELVSHPEFRPDPRWIAQRLRGRISVTEAQRAWDFLVERGFVRTDDHGRLVREEPADHLLATGHTATGEEVRRLAVANYHRQMFERASDSIESVDRSLRHLNAMTVGVSRDRVDPLRELVNDFIERVADLCESSEGADCVYQISVAAFPLTDVPDPEE